VIVKGFDTVPSDIDVENAGYDDPLLRPLATYPGGRSPTHRLGAQVPGATNGLNAFAYFNGSERHACYLRSDGALTNLVPLVDRTIPALRSLIGDANNQSRTTNAFTLGAVQALDAAAVTGRTLALRVRPAIGGVLTGGHSVQVLQPGATSVTVTAIANVGFNFSRWESEDASPYSADAGLAITNLNANLLLYASFSAAAVTWSFDLGSGATFDAGGHTITNLSVYPGDPAPAIPAYTVDDAHYLFNGWSPEIPAIVGAEARSFSASYTEKIFRIVRVAPTVEDGDDSGSSWANAKTNLQAAIDLAGQWQGEVWLKTGNSPHDRQPEPAQPGRRARRLRGCRGGDAGRPRSRGASLGHLRRPQRG
jgi:hypothetical protein